MRKIFLGIVLGSFISLFSVYLYLLADPSSVDDSQYQVLNKEIDLLNEKVKQMIEENNNLQNHMNETDEIILGKERETKVHNISKYSVGNNIGGGFSNFTINENSSVPEVIRGDMIKRIVKIELSSFESFDFYKIGNVPDFINDINKEDNIQNKYHAYVEFMDPSQIQDKEIIRFVSMIENGNSQTIYIETREGWYFTKTENDLMAPVILELINTMMTLEDIWTVHDE